MHPFSSIEYADLGIFLAVTDLETGKLYLNQEFWDHLPEHLQKWVFLHEQGHLVSGKRDEKFANDYADSHFIDSSDPDSFAKTTGELLDIHQNMLAKGKIRNSIVEQWQKDHHLDKRFAGEIVTAIIGLAIVATTYIVGEVQKDKAKRKSLSEWNKKVNASIDAEYEKAQTVKITNYAIGGVLLGIAVIVLLIAMRKK